MPWTAKLEAVAKKDGMVWAKVRYINDDPAVADIIAEPFGDDFDVDMCKLMVAHKLRSLNRHDDAFGSFAAANLKAGDTIEPSELNDDPPRVK